MSFWEELRRRKVIKVAVAYAVVAWVLVQVADTLFPALQLPEWSVTLVAALLILGFPVALVLSWAYELTPEGIRRSAEGPSSGSTLDMDTEPVYAFEGFRVSSRRRVLSRVGGEPIPLAPKVFDTLLYFVERPGQLLGKHELMEAIWPDVVVEENNLNQAISTLRRILGEVPGQHRFIVTEPGRGYRFVATVHVNESETADGLDTDGLRTRQRNPAPYTAVAVSAIVLLGGLIWYLQPDEDSTLPNSVAVLPLENLSPPENTFYADGMHAEIINQLSKLRSLNVIVRDSVLPYATDNRPPLSQIAAELNVRSIMTGSFQYVEGQIQVTVQLVDPITSTSLWSNDYREDFSRIFDVQADIATQVANALESELSANEQASIATVPTRSNDAYRLYLRALGVPNSAAARSLLEEALAIDPEFGAAHARLAREYAISMIQGLGGLNDTGLDTEQLDRLVEQHAEQALALDRSLTDAYLGQAWTHAFFWRWSEWLRADERLLEVSPNNVDGIRDYATATRAAGRNERSLQLAQHAVRLDTTAESLFTLGTAHREAGNLDEAIDAYRAGIRLNRDPLARLALGLVEMRNGNSAELEAQLRAVEPSVTNPNPATVALFAYAHGRIGHEDDAMRLFDRLREMSAEQNVGTGSWVLAYLAIGDTENALVWMERAAERAANNEPDAAFPQLLGIRLNSWADPVLERPEFVEVRSRITGS